MMYVIAIISVSLNSTINPILYYFANEHVRNKLIVMVRWHNKDRSNNNQARTSQIILKRTHTTRHGISTRTHHITTTTETTPIDNHEVLSSSSNSDNYRPITFNRKDSPTPF